MVWTVLWSRTQLARFKSTYDGLRGQDKKAANRLARAATKVDHLFERGPEHAGESRGDFERIVIVPPLTVTFEVHSEEHVVYVSRFHYAPS